MGLAGFGIKRTTPNLITTEDAFEPWFRPASKRKGEYDEPLIDDGGNTKFTTTTEVHNLQVGDRVAIKSSDGIAIDDSDSLVISTTGTTFTTDLPFPGTDTNDTGIAWNVDPIAWDNSTPADFLREVHIQFDTNKITFINVSLDQETWMDFNNATEIRGLVTVTMFVKKDTILNFRAVSTDITFSITVTGD
jgi:hypothetical protein